MSCYIKLTNWRGCIYFEYLTKNFISICTLRITLPSTNKTIIWKSLYWWSRLIICNISIDLKFFTSLSSVVTKYLSTNYIFIPIPTFILSHNYKPVFFKTCNVWWSLMISYIRIYSKFWSLFTSIMSKYLTINSIPRTILTLTSPYNYEASIW